MRQQKQSFLLVYIFVPEMQKYAQNQSLKEFVWDGFVDIYNDVHIYPTDERAGTFCVCIWSGPQYIDVE